MDQPVAWSRLLLEAAGERASQPRRICELCVRVLDITGAGMSVVTDAGVRHVVHATDDISAHIEELQVTLGEGPCVDAVERRTPVLVGDLTATDGIASERWPAFMAAAAEAGVRAVFAFPLTIGAIGIGAMDLYRTKPGLLSDAELSGALFAADAAAVALLDRDAGGESGSPGDFATPVTHEAQVHQATGMVKVQLDVSVEDAFLMLRARAFASGRSLADIASDVVEHRLRFSTEDL